MIKKMVRVVFRVFTDPCLNIITSWEKSCDLRNTEACSRFFTLLRHRTTGANLEDMGIKLLRFQVLKQLC